MLVVDASVVVSAIAFDGPLAQACRTIISNNANAALDLMRIEALSVLRRQVLNGPLTNAGAEASLTDLLELHADVYDNALLLQRSWELGDNLSTYDACHVALAEVLG